MNIGEQVKPVLYKVSITAGLVLLIVSFAASIYSGEWRE